MKHIWVLREDHEKLPLVIYLCQTVQEYITTALWGTLTLSNKLLTENTSNGRLKFSNYQVNHQLLLGVCMSDCLPVRLSGSPTQGHVHVR